MAKFKIGDRVRLVNAAGMSAKYGATATVTGQDAYLRVVWDRNHLAQGRTDGGYLERDFELVSAAPSPFTLLDDEGRKALKAGDRVLVEAMLHEDVGFGGDGDVELRTQGSEFEMGAFVRVSGLFALLPPAKKPIAVGDNIRILGRNGSTGKVLAFASNGHAVVEYAAGDGINVSHYDLSCLELI